MAAVAEIVCLWFARVGIPFLVIASVTPLLSSGAWYVRLFDFPRLQLCLLSLVVLVAIAIEVSVSRSGFHENVVLFLVALTVGLWQLMYIVPFTPAWPKELAHADHQDSVRLMIANVEMNNRRYSEALRTIEEQDPDLLLIIEMNESWREALEPLASQYPERTDVVRDEGLGIAFWSKLPVSNAEVKHLVSERRASIFADVTLPGGNVAQFIGLHPTPPGLRDQTAGGRRDSRVRDAELVLVARKVEEIDHPCIVAGDFNDVAWSRTTRLFKRLSGLRDPRVGRALLNTYHAEYPLMRYPIDQVFLPKDSTVSNLERVPIAGSDHFAIVVDMHVAWHNSSEEASTEEKEAAEQLVEEGKEDAEDRNVKSNER